MSRNSSSSSLTAPSPLEEFKIVFIGDKGAGKSSLVIRLCYGFFDENQPSDFESKTYQKEIFPDGKQCMLQLVDTSYPEEGGCPPEKWIEESDAVVIVYNVSKLPWRSTPLEVIRKYHEVVERVKEKQGIEMAHFPVLVLGAQNDRLEERVVEAVDGQSLADELGATFGECSALEGDVEKPIFDLVRCIREQRIKVARAEEVQTAEKKGERKHSLKALLDQLEDVSHTAWVFGRDE